MVNVRRCCVGSLVERVFRDFKGRQAGIIKALTTDFEEFFRKCDPVFRSNKKNILFLYAKGNCGILYKPNDFAAQLQQLNTHWQELEKESLCLFGLPNEQWAVCLPVNEVPPPFPEPVLGINFARDALGKEDWLFFIAAHSDAWLVAMAFHYALRLGLTRAQRGDIFIKINELPTVLEVVDSTIKEPPATNRNSSKSKSKSKAEQQRQENSQAKRSKAAAQHLEADAGPSEVAGGGQGETLCEGCNQSSPSDGFWIWCDSCNTWLHGKCVGITPERAEHIELYACPTCTAERRRLREHGSVVHSFRAFSQNL